MIIDDSTIGELPIGSGNDCLSNILQTLVNVKPLILFLLIFGLVNSNITNLIPVTTEFSSNPSNAINNLPKKLNKNKPTNSTRLNLRFSELMLFCF